MLSGQFPGTYGMGEESVGRGCGDGGPGDEASISRLVELQLHEGRFIRIEHMETEVIPVIKESSFREIY